MQPVKRGKRRRREMPYLSASGCTVNSCMTVIGNPMERYKDQSNCGSSHRLLPQFPWKSAQAGYFLFTGGESHFPSYKAPAFACKDAGGYTKEK